MGLQSAWKPLSPVLFFLFVAVAFSWPLVLNVSNGVIATGSGDIWQHLWNIWWMRFSLLDLHSSPYTTPLLFQPQGANLFFHALDPLDGYLSVPLQLVFGLVSAFNLIILFQLTLAGWSTYLLATYLTGNKKAGLVAGLIYACSPLESRLLNLGQLELTSIGWLPLYIFCFIKTLNEAERPWLWRSLSVGLLVVLSLVTWYYLLYALLFSVIYGLFQLWQARKAGRKQCLQTLALITGVISIYGLLILPLLIPTLQAAGSGSTSQPIFTVIYNSATLGGFFSPGPSVLWGLLGSKETPEFRGNFLGFITLGLAGWGLISSFKKNWFWAIVAVIFCLLALGPVLHLRFNPDWTPQTIEDGLSLPGRLLYYLPFGNIARVPLRFGLISMLALAVLAAFGVHYLTAKMQTRFTKSLISSWIVPLLACLLVFLEFFPGPRTLVDTAVSAFYEKLAQEGRWDDFAILETPDQSNASIISKAMYYQTVHGHPIVGGYLSRKPFYPVKDYPGLYELLNLNQNLNQRDILDRRSLGNAPGVLQYYNIRYVIVHTDLLTSEDSRYNAQELLQTVFGPGAAPYYEDATIQVWKTPDYINRSNQPEPAKMLPRLSEGWGKRLDTESGPERLVTKQSRLSLFNPYDKPVQIAVRLKIRRESEQTGLNISLNGKLISQKTFLSSSPEYLDVKITLNSGPNEMMFDTAGSGGIYFGTVNFEFRNMVGASLGLVRL